MTMASLATLQIWLSEAEAARHRLITGALTASITYAGRSVSYSQSSMGSLNAYIEDLKAQIATASGQPVAKTRIFRVYQRSG